MMDEISGCTEWIVEQDLHLRDLGLPAPFAELVADEDGGLVIGRGAGDVRLGGEDAEPSPSVLGRGHGQGVRLGRALGLGRPRREADRVGTEGRIRTQDRGQDEDCGRRHGVSGSPHE